MPYVNIKITREGNVTPEQKKQLIEGATELLHRNWGIGGVPVTEIRKQKK